AMGRILPGRTGADRPSPGRTGRRRHRGNRHPAAHGGAGTRRRRSSGHAARNARGRLMSGIGSHDSVTVRVPMTFRERGGRKQLIAPDGVPSWALPRARIDSTMIKALARAFRWRRMLETGAVATIKEIAAKAKI